MNTNNAGYPECPGISPEMVQRSQLVYLSEAEAKAEIGYEWACYRIPYLDLDEKPIGYNRYRLNVPLDKMKYFQPSGSGVHGYLPVGLKALNGHEGLIVVEGERKAMALVEAGYAAVGIGGFYGFAPKGGGVLVPELKSAIDYFKPKKIYFLGDSDTGHNYQFSNAVIKFRKLISKCELLLPRIAWDSKGKGVDDIRAILGAGFNTCFDQLLLNAVKVDDAMNAGELALLLVESEIGAVKNLDPAAHRKVEKRLIEVAGALEKHPLEQDKAIKLVAKEFDLDISTVKKCAQASRAEVLKEISAKKNGGQYPRNGGRAGGSTPAKGVKKIEAIILPSEGFTHVSTTAGQMYPLMADSGKYFRRGRGVCEVTMDGKGYSLAAVTANGLMTRIENLEVPVVRLKKKDGETKATLSNLKDTEAKALLEAREVELLPLIKGLASCPVMAADAEGGCRIAESGYDAGTGVFVTCKDRLPPLPTVEEARDILLELLADFDFQTPADKSRAVALLLTPALMLGQFIRTLAPMLMVEANASQTGKNYLLDLVAKIYNQMLAMVTQHSGRGVGSSEEAFHQALCTGYPFIVFDNWRGTFDMPSLESFLTDRNDIQRVRLPHEGYVEVNRSHYVLGMTSNGLQFAKPDMANRIVFIRLRKHPENYLFRSYAEGDLLAHVGARWTEYLAAIYAIILNWSAKGSPRLGTRMDSFTEWAQIMDWIVRETFKLPPLLEGAKADKVRVSSPILTFVRETGLVLKREEKLGQSLNASDLAMMASQNNIVIPNCNKLGDLNAAARSIGIAMSYQFKDGIAELTAAGFRVERAKKVVKRDDGSGGNYDMWYYVFTEEAAALGGGQSQ
jgi:hypothetical protein